MTLEAPQERGKCAAGRRAAELARDGMRVGLGTGSTVRHTILALAERRPDVRCVATSEQTRALALELGLRVEQPDALGSLDLALDGADEVDPARNLLKGRGGAQVREKIVASMARRFVVVVDESKLSARLGSAPVALEVLPFAPGWVADAVRALGAERVDVRPEASDNGCLLMDAHFGSLGDPEEVGRALDALPGLVGHGIFPSRMVERVIVGASDGCVRELEAEQRRCVTDR